MTGIEALNDWIMENTDKDSRIFTVLQRGVSLATNRETIWDSRIWFLENDNDIIRYRRDLYKSDYIIIKESDIKVGDAYSGPGDIPSDSKFLELISESEAFEEVYGVQDFKIYQLKTDYLKL